MANGGNDTDENNKKLPTLRRILSSSVKYTSVCLAADVAPTLLPTTLATTAYAPILASYAGGVVAVTVVTTVPPLANRAFTYLKNKFFKNRYATAGVMPYAKMGYWDAEYNVKDIDMANGGSDTDENNKRLSTEDIDMANGGNDTDENNKKLPTLRRILSSSVKYTSVCLAADVAPTLSPTTLATTAYAPILASYAGGVVAVTVVTT